MGNKVRSGSVGRRAIAGFGALAVFLAAGGQARGQGYVVGSGRSSLTWPRVSVSVTRHYGSAVAVGRTTDGGSRILWRVPLVRGKGSVAVQYGLGTVYIRIGSAQFVIDSASGQTLRQAQMKALKEAAPHLAAKAPAATTRPATELPERSEAVRLAETHLMDLAAKYNLASLALTEMRRQKADERKLADAEAKLAALGKETDAAYAALRKLRAAEMPPAVRQAAPQLRTKIEQAEQRVAKLTEAHDDAHRQFLEVQKAYGGGRAGAEKLEAAEAGLLKALKDLTGARRELADLVRSAVAPGKP